LRTLVRRHRTITFVLLAFAITWAVWVPNVLVPDSVVGTVAPSWTRSA
jgi:hypothetical protein